MRILQVIGSLNRGGAETFLMNLLRSINRDEYEFIFLCYGEEAFDYEDEVISLGAKIVCIPDVKRVGVLRHVKDLKRVMKEERIDVVHIHTYFNSMFALIAAKSAGIRARITHSHNTLSEKSPSFIKLSYFMISKLAINTLSTHYVACGDDAGRTLFYKKNTFTVIHNGVVVENFYYNENIRQNIRSKMNVQENDTVIIHVARFEEAKNHSFLIDIFNVYLSLNPNSILMLIGDGSKRKEIELKVAQLGIDKSVKFLGKLSNVNEMYNAADLCVFPSLYEGLPVALIEAQVNGLPCIISDTVDKGIAITECIHSESLEMTARHWAELISKVDTGRLDTKAAIKNSPYDMKNSINTIEEMYLRVMNYGELK